MPTAVTSVNRDVKSDITASIGSLGKAKVGDIAIKTEVEANNLFAKYPNVDKSLALQTMASTYCEILRGTTAISDTEKIDRWERFQIKVLALEQSVPKPTQAKPHPQPQPERSVQSGTPASQSSAPASGSTIYVPKEIQFIYVFLQDPNRMKEAAGCIPRADGISSEVFTQDFDSYRAEARQNKMRIIITATPDRRDWVLAASKIRIDGRPLTPEVEYSCHAPKRDFGYEAPL
jgi:hypothetical protein